MTEADPATVTFLLASGKMGDGRPFMTETKLEDDSVLMAGGYANSPEAANETWIYRPGVR